LASLPEVRGIILPANRQPGAEAPGNTKSAYGEKPGLSGAAFFDLYTDPREESGKMLPTFPAKGMLNVRTVR
jgi:arylsulfatase